MIESIITISIAGILAGFIFSMPIAGPVSILITSNALKGKLRYCNLVSLGASIADFAYVFVAVYGLTRLYSLYKPAIPYMLVAGALLFFFLGYRIFRTKIEIENLDDKIHLPEKVARKVKGGFYTGFMINLLNPTLFIGVLTSSFFVISLISSLGYNTGGLSAKMDQNVNEINKMEGRNVVDSKSLTISQFDNIKVRQKEDFKPDQTKYPSYFHLVISICYAFSLSLGSISWFYLMAFLIVRFRHHINIKVISVFVKSLGILLFCFGLYFVYMAYAMIF